MAVLALAVQVGALHKFALLGAIGAIPAAIALRWAWQDPDTFYRYRPAQALALLAFVLLSAGITTGTLFGAR